MEILKEIKKSLFTTASIYIFFGIIMIIFPVFVNDFFSTIVGVLILLFGLSQVTIYLSQKNFTGMIKVTLGIGIIGILLGIYILLNPKFIASIIPLISGLVIIVNSINSIKQAVEFRKMNYKNWWYNLIASFLLFVTGCILIINPFGAVEMFIRILGIILIIDGIYNIFIIKACLKKERKIVKSIK